MARISSTTVSISDLNSTFGFGNSLSGYQRSSTSVKSNTVALVPVGNTVSMGRMRGAFPSGTYRDLNVYASSTTSGINVTPRNFNQAYNSGLSNNADPSNAYTLYYTQTTGNQGYSTTTNVFRQDYYTLTDFSQSNGMYFRISNVAFPYYGPFEQEGSWVIAIGLNYIYSSLNYFYDIYAWNFYGGGNSYYAVWYPSIADVFNGNNFFAFYVSGGTFYYGMVNRAQLRAGVIQPVYSIAFSGVDSLYWYNSMDTFCARIGACINGSPANLDFRLGWDEYIVRGYDLPNPSRLYGYGDTTTRNTLINSGSAQYIDGRIFE